MPYLREQYYRDKALWLDAGAGTCGTMREIARKGHEVEVDGS